MTVMKNTPGSQAEPAARQRRWTLVTETCAVLAAPLIAFFVLRIRAMAPVGLPDPSMHTIYIVGPSQMFQRYAAAFSSTARMREGAQAGFLVIARVAYLIFGLLPGFFVTRYLFALIAIVPAYLLFRRLYGRPAGVMAIVVLLSSPVLITAWGTDYPDCAVVSYITGAVACLAMPCTKWRRPWWLAGAGALLTMAIWSHGMGIMLAAATVVVYAALRTWRDREHLISDALELAIVALGVTAVLMLASKVVLGEFDFIVPTLKAALYLNRPSQTRIWHTADRQWALYVPYLLVPPATIAMLWVTLARKVRTIPTPQLFIALACTVQVALFAFLQFFSHVQTLEMHFFSSTLWGVVCMALVVAIAEITRPLSARPLLRWLPAIVLLAVPLAYELDAHVPAFTWWPAGAVLAAAAVLVACAMRLGAPRHRRSSVRGPWFALAASTAIVAMSGSLLVLTVAPSERLPGVDPSSGYAEALGGSATNLIDWYVVSADLPSFVSNPAYNGEQLLMWLPHGSIGRFIEPIGMFHAGFNLLPNGLPKLTAADAADLAHRRPAELLLISATGALFSSALSSLRTYRPLLLRTAVIRHGTVALHVWLILLGTFARPNTR
jgi:4-amino-4-deoxy-L-arabinose transferase-like glycosyltransferase